jgi:2-methylisocitrate lyase-like PEP mutase family enzyme
MHLGEPAHPQRPGARLRARMQAKKPLVIPGCYNAMSARVLEHVGFEAIYMSGYGTSLALLGMPDAGLTTLTEVAMNARFISAAVRVPVIADADTGYGNALNAIRTVEEYIRAGCAGLHLEDQVAPKRCGHVAGREVIDREEAVRKIRAACAARDAMDKDFVIVSRTDSRGAHGGSLDEAIWRANAALDAGADLAFVEGPASVAEVERICREVKGPIFYNMTGISPRFTEQEMAQLGIAVTILPGMAMRATLMALYDAASALKAKGMAAEPEFDKAYRDHPMRDLHGFAGFARIRALEEQFLPPQAIEKYADGLGYRPPPASKAAAE